MFKNANQSYQWDAVVLKYRAFLRKAAVSAEKKGNQGRNRRSEGNRRNVFLFSQKRPFMSLTKRRRLPALFNIPLIKSNDCGIVQHFLNKTPAAVALFNIPIAKNRRRWRQHPLNKRTTAAAFKGGGKCRLFQKRQRLKNRLFKIISCFWGSLCRRPAAFLPSVFLFVFLRKGICGKKRGILPCKVVSPVNIGRALKIFSEFCDERAHGFIADFIGDLQKGKGAVR